MDLDIRRVIKSIPKDYGPEELAPLLTPWGEALGDDEANVNWQHPRPQLARENWVSLNGWWECAFVAVGNSRSAWRNATPPEVFDRRIRVPFSPEASLSGVNRQLQPTELLWYRRTFETPELPARGGCILHFDGVDFACAVYVNGSKVAEHEGAYLPFKVDITHLLKEEGNTVTLCVHDPSETGTQLRGKQRLKRGGMWYTAQSGIWQEVWLEVVPRTHVEELLLEPNIETGEITVTVHANGISMLEAWVLRGDEVLDEALQSRRVHGHMSVKLTVPDHQLWSPENPQVYEVRVCYGEDVVWSNVAFRTVGIEPDEQGVPRLCLNHNPLFVRGLLDQGMWPDGLLTPPSTEAMAADLRAVLRHGFNLVRKHVKVESERFYDLCDRMGILVLQDMPTGGDLPSDRWSRDLPTLRRKSWHSQVDTTEKSRARLGATDATYREEWTQTTEQIVTRLGNHPCIIGWVLFNESWGQFDAAAATQMVQDLDGSRPVVSASGWYDQGTGDIQGIHNYFRGIHMFDDPFATGDGQGLRAQMYTEFGGLTWRIEDHAQLEHTYGYAEFETLADWRAGYEKLIAEADALEAQGLSGFVYTQLTDVEEETNGILTYDRRIDKLEL